MARLLVRLKLALLASSLKRGWQQKFGLLVGVVYMVPVAIAAAIGLGFFGRAVPVEAAKPVLVLLFVVLWVLWLVAPLLAFGLDETLDPSRLRLLPLRAPQLVVGLAVASLVGIAPLGTVIALLGVPAGFAPLGPGLVLVVGGTFAELALCVVGARALVTWLSPKLRSRRGRDVTALLGGALALVVAALAQIPNLLTNVLDVEGDQVLATAERSLAAGVAVISFTPPGWAGRAVSAGAEGDLLEGLGWLALACAAVAGLGWVWSRALARALVGGDEVTGEVHGADQSLAPVALRFLPAGHVAAATWKEVRYLTRVPELRATLFFPVVLTVAGTVAIMLLPALRRPEVVLAAPAAAVLLSFAAVNSFAADRGAVWLLVVASDDARADLLGKNLALAAVSLPLVVIAALGLAAATGGWALVPSALALGVVVLAVSCGVGNVASVVAPAPMPERSGNAFAGQANTGVVQALRSMLAIAIEGALSAPPVVALILTALFAPVWQVAAVPFALAWGAGVLWLGLRTGAARLSAKGPEFVAALTQERAA